MENDKLSKFKEIVTLLDKDVPSATEVAELIAQIIKVVQDVQAHLEKQAKQNKQTLSQEVSQGFNECLERLEKVSKDLGDKLKKDANKVLDNLKENAKIDLDKITVGLYQELKRVEKLIPSPTDLSEVFKRIDELKSKLLPELTGEQIVDKINVLPIEPEFQIDKEHIKGLVEELLAIRSLPRGGGGARRIFQPYRADLSASCDGSNKTFYLPRAPLDDATVQVYGTDFPVILRPTIDFTIANKVLTLTSAVPAPNSGATLICTFFA